MVPITPQDEEQLKNSIWQDAADIVACWTLWADIFNPESDNDSVVQESLPQFCNTLDYLLTNQIISGLSKLTDKTKNTRTFEKVVKKLNISDDELNKQITQFKEHCKNLVQYRHDNIAHSSLSPKLKAKETPKISEVEQAIKLMKDIIKTITSPNLSFAEYQGGEGQLRTVCLDAKKWRDLNRQLFWRKDGAKSNDLSSEDIINIITCIRDNEVS